MVFHQESESGAWLTSTKRSAAPAERANRDRHAAASNLPVLCMAILLGIGAGARPDTASVLRGRPSERANVPGAQRRCNAISNRTPQTNLLCIARAASILPGLAPGP